MLVLMACALFAFVIRSTRSVTLAPSVPPQVLEIVAEFALHLATTNGDNAHLFSGATNSVKISAAPSGKPLMQQPPRKDAASAAPPHLVVITAMKALILRPQLTLGAASILLRPRYQPIAAFFLDILQPSSSTLGSPMSRNSSRASLGGSKAGNVGSAPSALLRSPTAIGTAFGGMLASPSSIAVSSAAPSHVPSLLLATAQAAAAEAAALEAAARPASGQVATSIVATTSSCAANGVGPAKLQRRVYVGSPQLDWGTLRLNQHVRVFGKQHPHGAAGVSALAQLSSTKFAVGFFAEPASTVPDGGRVANARAASTHVGAIGVPSSHDSNLALIDLKLRRALDEADDAPPPSMLDHGTTTTAMLPAAPHMINALTVWRNLVIGGDGAGTLHVWAQTDPRRPESWTRQSAVQLDSGLSSLQVWCDRLLCAQVDRPAQLRSLPDVSHVEQTLRVSDHDADNAGFHAADASTAGTDAEAEASAADANACSQTWFFPAIEVGGHPGFVTAQTALTVWMRDPHFARHKPAPAFGDAAGEGSGAGGDSSAGKEAGILGLGLGHGADQGATLVVLNDPELVDADDEAQQGYSAVRVRPGESRAWLTPAADQQSVRCLAVAHLSPLDAAPVFGLAVGTDQSHIYCGLEMTGEVIEVRLELYPHAHLVRTQRITVFETGCSVSRLLLLDDVLIAASSSPLVGADGADGLHEDDADLDEDGRVGTTLAQSRVRIMRRAPTVMPDALIAGLSIGDAAAALGLDASFDSAAVSAVTSPLPVDAAAGHVNPFDQPAWDEALIGAHTGAGAAAALSSHHAHGVSHHPGGLSMADALLAAERQRLADEDEAAQLMEAADDPDLCPLPARMRRADDEPLPPPPPHFSLDQVAPRAWHALHHLDVRRPVFDLALLDHALVVGGVSGDVLVFSSM